MSSPGTRHPAVAPPGTVRSDLRDLERAENFPVALRLLPATLRQDLQAVYDVVRTIDDLGDELPVTTEDGRTTALLDLADDLATVWTTGTPERAVLSRLVPVVRRRALPPEPFQQLVQANLQDQQVSRYASFRDLLDYCRLSAAPIGTLVLHLFDAVDPARQRLSDQVCAGLQVVEHLQDVGEDRRAGRVYLPTEDLAAFGVPEDDLDAGTASPALRRLVLHEADRVDDLLDAGGPLVASLHGWARPAVAGYLAGGRAAVDAVRRVHGDVLGQPARTRRRDVLAHLVRALAGGRR